MGDESVPAVQKIEALRSANCMREGNKRSLLSSEDFVMHIARIQAVLGIASEIANAEQPEDLLHREDRKVVDLAACINEHLASRRPVREQQIRETGDALFVTDYMADLRIAVQDAGRNVNGERR